MPTLKDIAHECGVTTATVSMAINGKGRIAPETRNRIMEAAGRLNYHSNSSSAVPEKVKTRTIGLIMPGIHNWAGGFYHRAVTAAMETAPAFGHDCKILSTDEFHRRTVDEFHKGPGQLGCDHIVFFCPNENWKATLPALKAWGMVSAVIRRPVDTPGISCITDDDYTGFRMGMEHLAGLGHKTVILLRAADNKGISDRDRAYWDVVKERGLIDDERLVLSVDELNDPMPGRILRLREAGLDATAIMCNGDHLAVNAAQSLLRAGIRIPADISIMGYDDDPLCREFYPNISSVKIPVEEMMTAAFRAVIDPAPELAGTRQTITFGNELIIRESTGPVKNA